MRKKGLLVLLILGVLLLMGCENEAGKAITPLEVHDIADTWGQRTTQEPGISFQIDPDDLTLYMMDIVLTNGPPLVGYGVEVSTTDQNTITGTYGNLDPSIDPNEYPIKITLFYKDPKLTVKITGKGPLAGQTYVVKPKPD